MKKLVLYIHGKGGSAAEAEHYKPLFPNCDVVGLEYTSQFPWEALNEFPTLFDELCPGYDSVDLIANSIGAFFAMHALSGKQIEKTHFISPVVDMEKLIMDMMGWANVTEDELHNKQTIPTNFGETLSWEYLCYVRANPMGSTHPHPLWRKRQFDFLPHNLCFCRPDPCFPHCYEKRRALVS